MLSIANVSCNHLNLHGQQSSGTSCLDFGPICTVIPSPYFVCAGSNGSEKIARLCRQAQLIAHVVSPPLNMNVQPSNVAKPLKFGNDPA